MANLLVSVGLRVNLKSLKMNYQNLWLLLDHHLPGANLFSVAGVLTIELVSLQHPLLVRKLSDAVINGLPLIYV